MSYWNQLKLKNQIWWLWTSKAVFTIAVRQCAPKCLRTFELFIIQLCYILPNYMVSSDGDYVQCAVGLLAYTWNWLKFRFIQWSWIIKQLQVYIWNGKKKRENQTRHNDISTPFIKLHSKLNKAVQLYWIKAKFKWRISFEFSNLTACVYIGQCDCLHISPLRYTALMRDVLILYCRVVRMVQINFRNRNLDRNCFQLKFNFKRYLIRWNIYSDFVSILQMLFLYFLFHIFDYVFHRVFDWIQFSMFWNANVLKRLIMCSGIFFLLAKCHINDISYLLFITLA